MNSLLIFPDKFAKGGTTPITPAPFEDFTAPQDTDAHAAAYLLPTGGPCPRLNHGHLAKLIEDGAEPLLNYVFCDIDNENHEHWTPDQAELHWAKLKKTGPEILKNAGFYSTRGGYRLVFRLKRPLLVSLAGHFIKQFFNHLRAAGVPVDPACVPSWNTLYRLPRVTRDGEALAAFVDLVGLDLPLSWVAPIPLQCRIAAASDTKGSGPRPDLRELTDQEWERIATTIDHHKIDRLKKAEPLARSGRRQETMFKVASLIVGKLGLDDPEMVYQALAPSVAAGGGISFKDLWDRCCYLVHIDKAKRAAREKITEEQSGETPPIVFDGRSGFYIYDTTGETYRPPVSATAICSQLERFCRIPGLQTRGGNNKPMGAAEYLADLGRVAVEVIAEMGREKSIFKDDVLIEGCCVAVETAPEHNEEIAHWLRLIGGDQHEKLLDWIATAADLSLPTAGVYLQGPPGTGKGLFAHGIAALFGSGATSYADAVGKFNGALCKNPVCHIDEISQTFDTGEGFSGSFRSLIGESSRQLRRKNLPSSTLRGCPRLIIGANNADALRFSESLTKADLEAIAQRILHIQHDEAPREFLRSLGGRSYTKNWVLEQDGSPGAFARHAVHLAKTRRVVPGDRFLVEGELSEWHKDLMGSTGVQGDVLAALAYYAARDRDVAGLEISPDLGAVWVNGPALRGQWEMLLNRQAPDENKIARALKVLGGGKVHRRHFKHTPEGSRLRCYRLELADVTRRAEALQIGDLPSNPEDEIADVIPF